MSLRKRRMAETGAGSWGGSRKRKPPIALFVCLLVLTVLAAAVAVWYGQGRPDLYPASSSAVPSSPGDDSDFSVTFVDVGQGDCALVQCDGQYMLIDTGVKEAEKQVLNALYNRGITTLDYLVLTHPHADHIGNGAAVIRNMNVKQVLMPDAAHNTSTFEKLLSAMEKKGLTATVPEIGETFSLGSATCRVLRSVSCTDEDNLNDASLVLTVEYAGRRVLFAADAGTLAQKDMMDAFDLSADIYKVAHHGSTYDNSLSFLQAISPTYAVISCDGQGSQHPHPDTITRLTDIGAAVYRTDRDGSVTLSISPEGVISAEIQKTKRSDKPWNFTAASVM